MATVSGKVFARPEVLAQIGPGLLARWLWPMRGYFEGRGLRMPPPGSGEGPDPETLARILMEPTPDMPADLLECLYLVGEMANPAGMDAILADPGVTDLARDLGQAPTAAEVVLHTWMRDRGLLERLHHFREFDRPRAFRYFSTDADPPPPFDGPAPDQLANLEHRLNDFYAASRRGRGARVFHYNVGRDCWFLVRHGAPCRREAALDCDRPASVFFRPQRHDVLVYDRGRGELRVHCCPGREQAVLVRLFGKCLFGRNDFFPGVAKYTLAPLVRRGRACLSCAGVSALDRVRLTEVEFFFSGNPWKRVIQQAGDIFDLVERDELEWPASVEDIRRATFEVTFRGVRRPRRLTLVPCNKALYSRDGDAATLEDWLGRQEFLLPEWRAQ